MIPASSRRVLVVGGGIAGFAMLRACAQRGIAVSIVERSTGPAARRLGLNLPGNAVRALRALGIGDQLLDHGVPIRRREYRNARGRLVFAVDEAAFWADGDGSRCLRREDLLDLLRADAPPDVVRWGLSVRTIASASGTVDVGFSDSTVERYDFVVGADGVHSTVRNSLPQRTVARTARLSAASWRFEAPNPGVNCWTVWSGAAGTVLLIPVDADRVYGYASATRGGPVDQDSTWLRSTFDAYPDPVRRAVSSALAEPTSLYYSPIEEVRLPTWHSQRAVLIGDAAHATAPVWAQGVAMAAEDALVLADLLASTNDWSAVGEEFERRRRSRVEHVQSMTDRLSRAAGLPSLLRDAILPILGPRMYKAAYAPLREPAVSARS